MSLKVLRKLQERDGTKNSIFNIDAEPKEEDEEEEDPENDEKDASLKTRNRFDLLLGGSHSDSEAKEDDDLTEVASGQISGSNRRNSVGLSLNDFLHNSSGARKKKKKKKKKSAKSKYPASSEDQMDLDIDEVERSVREVNELLGEAKQISSSPNDIVDKAGRGLLCVEHKHLNPQNEMKRIFGAKVVQAGETKKRNLRSGGSTRQSRGTWIVQGQPNWGQHSKPGLSMVLVESTPTYNLFKFQHNAAYQLAQFKFLEAVESLNPDNILSLLHIEPFHVDTLLQVSEIFRLADDSAMSAQLIERAIFVMESVAHPLFNVTTGTSRLNFKQQENRGFFVAVFRHILNVGLKGCYRTALELCKLLLSLSPDDDPMAVSLMLDFYAIRSQEYAWLIALYDLYEPTKNLSMLPNFSFSVPLALYHLSQLENSSKKVKDKADKAKSCISNIGTPDQLKERADDMLQRAIIMFPGVIQPLLDKCNIMPDIKIESHPYFGESAQVSMNKGLSQIVNLYVGRNYHVWKEVGVISWLEENFRVALKRVDSKDALAEESEKKRRLRYQGTPTAIYRHILLAEVSNATAALPPSLANSPVMSYDPLPPHDSICDYNRPKSASRSASSSSSILASFFRGLLPTYDPNSPEVEPQEGDGAVGGDDVEGAGAELRASVNTLLEAMRNLFSNINLTEHGPDEDADRSEEEEDDDGAGPRQWD